MADALVSPYLLHQFKTVHARHHHIGDEQIRHLIVVEKFPSLLAVTCPRIVVALVLQHLAHEESHVRIVLSNKHILLAVGILAAFSRTIRLDIVVSSNTLHHLAFRLSRRLHELRKHISLSIAVL